MKQTSRFSFAFLLALAGIIVWLLLNPWQPLDLPGPEEAEYLGRGNAPPPLAGLTDKGVKRTALLASPQAKREILVLDGVTRRPVPGAELILLGKPSRLLGRTDENGLIALGREIKPSRLALRHTGHLGLLLGLPTPFCQRLQATVMGGQGQIPLPPDPITRVLRGRVLAANERALPGARVTMLVLEPGDPARPPVAVPPGLAPAWRMGLATEQLCYSLPLVRPWELGKWRPRVSTKARGRGEFGFHTISSGPALVRVSTADGRGARQLVSLPLAEPLRLFPKPGSRLLLKGPPGSSATVYGADGWHEPAPLDKPGAPWRPGEVLRVRLILAAGTVCEKEVTMPAAGKVATLSFLATSLPRQWSGKVVELGTGVGQPGVQLRCSGSAPVTTDRDGRFSILLPGGASVAVEVTGAEIMARRVILTAAGVLPTAVAVLPRSSSAQVRAGLVVRVAGEVLSPEGELVAGARVVARPAGFPMGNFSAPGQLTCRTDGVGEFLLFLPTGENYEVTAQHLVLGKGRCPVRAVGGIPIKGLRIRLAPPAVLTGEVRHDGVALAGVLVTVSRPGEPAAQTRTTAEGTFKVNLLAAGKWTVTVRGPGGKTVQKDVVVAAGDLGWVVLDF